MTQIEKILEEAKNKYSGILSKERYVDLMSFLRTKLEGLDSPLRVVKFPENKETHEDGTGHNCDVKGCPMCWNDGYNQAREDCIKAYESAQPTGEGLQVEGLDEDKVRKWYIKSGFPVHGKWTNNMIKKLCQHFTTPKISRERLEPIMDKVFEREDVWYIGELCFVSFKKKLFQELEGGGEDE